MTIQIISTLQDRTPVPQEKPLEEAEVVWGGPSNFSWGSQSKDYSSGPSIRSSNGDTPPDNPENQPKAPITYYWQEVSRKESDARIYGSNDAYVDFKLIDEVTFRLPDLDDGTQVFVVQSFDNSGGTTTSGTTGSTPITAKWIVVPKSA